ncbi:SDR family oxidoreductase [Gordonia sp. (in: high G+C Gram-positive bacteria)]|uniref:SDR family oxidoreductase n=1 Tax=Gordonia sp. (in: high G+C Gram-positive bacteria) TaxID=84139 RepID=UPI00169932B6|nr:SDR family oxidoreductase [Gordonia sp. (in: high G+C Gram-positive bacteria)]NLG46906.1 SDR family oxidoreductase [Gordonia sp. (in: high G+C Gram-positive bacteria)]
MRLSGMITALLPGAYARQNPRIELEDAVVIVTGAARGIGAEAAAMFAAAGSRVWVTDVDADDAARLASTIDGARSARLDVTDRGAWGSVVDEVLTVDGRIDILVNNAGVMPTGPFAEEAAATTDLILDVNVKGVLNGMGAVLPTMVDAGRGHIVNVASMAGMLPLPGMVTYNASKFAAYGASLAARREYDGTGVTVSAVLPSAVRTELSSGADLGGVLPTVDPDDVVRAIVRTVRTRAARVSSPGWVLPGWALVDQFVPESVERVVRELVGHRQAMALDPVERATYLARLERQTLEHSQTKDQTR